MENKCLEISIPEGYEIDRENSSFEKIVFKPVNQLPTSWEELNCLGGAYVDTDSTVKVANSLSADYYNRNTWPTVELAGASIVLAQLLQLRDVYNNDWTPDWSDYSTKYSIVITDNIPSIAAAINVSHVLTFKTKELRDKFLNNFQDLLEIAKPLL